MSNRKWRIRYEGTEDSRTTKLYSPEGDLTMTVTINGYETDSNNFWIDAAKLLKALNRGEHGKTRIEQA